MILSSLARSDLRFSHWSCLRLCLRLSDNQPTNSGETNACNLVIQSLYHNSCVMHKCMIHWKLSFVFLVFSEEKVRRRCRSPPPPPPVHMHHPPLHYITAGLWCIKWKYNISGTDQYKSWEWQFKWRFESLESVLQYFNFPRTVSIAIVLINDSNGKKINCTGGGFVVKLYQSCFS